MPQLELGLQAIQNRRLFRDHYLRDRLPQEQPEWREDVAPLRAAIAELLGRIAPTAADLNEATLEGDLIRPALELLGFSHEQWVEKQHAESLEPDYTVFPAAAAKREALGSRAAGQFYEKATCLVEAKAWTVDLDRRVGRERSPMAQLKRYLVESGVSWGILTNGREWRLLRREGPVDTYYGVRLPELLDHPEGEFRYFALFFRRSAFEADFLSRVESESRRYSERLEADLRDRMRDALLALGRGLLASDRQRRGDPEWRPTGQEVRRLFDASMLVLYRLLFSLYAEARELLPVHAPAYARYSMRALAEDIAGHIGRTREPADFDALSTTVGAWFDRARALWRLVENGEGHPGAELFVPRYNGGLFRSAPVAGTPLAEAVGFLGQQGVGIPDRWFSEALDTLTRIEISGQLEFVDYADLRERQLGSIYEGLLELHFGLATEPMVAVRRAGREIWVVSRDREPEEPSLESISTGELFVRTDTGERRATGAFYTPQWVVEYIVERALEPLLSERSTALRDDLDRLRQSVARTRAGSQARAVAEQALAAAQRDAVNRLLDLRILDPAMGSGHFLVEALEYVATWTATDPSYEPSGDNDEADLAGLRRLVAERCLYGVDVSYLTVELAKLSLWLRTMIFGKPLDFLDHHLRWGNSLIGIRDLEELAHLGRDEDQVDAQQLDFPLGQAISQTQRFAAMLEQISQMATDTIEEVRTKEELLGVTDRERVSLRRVADLHTALRFGHTLAPRRDELVAALEESAVRQADMFGADQQQRELFSRGRAPGALDSRFYQAVAHTLRDPALHGSLGQLDRFLDDTRALAEQHRPFHWPIEFSDVWFTERGSRETPGFDAVIGNPPYLRMERFKEIKPFLKAVYRTHESRADLYVYFVERAHRLLRGGGRLGMILSNKFLRANYGGPLRAFLAESTTVEEVVDFGGSGVFEGATVRPAIVLATATTGATKPLRFVAVRSLQFERLDRAVAEAVQAVPRAAVSGGTWRLLAAETETLLDRLAAVSIPLGEYVGGQICWGVKTGLNDAFWVERATRDRLLAANPEAAEVLRPLVVGDNVRRYHIESSERWLLYMHHGVDIGRYPAVERYLERFREKLEQRATKQAWYELQQPQEAYRSFLEGSKLLFPIITSTARFCIADGPLYPNDKCFFVPTDDSFLLALLNTKLMFSYLLHTAAKLEGSPGDNPFIELRAQYMTLVPIRRVSQQHAGDAEVRRRLVALAEELQADAVLAAIDTLLPLDEGGVPELDQEHSAPVRDLLAHLGRRMTELHRERQTIERVFTEWLAYSGTETARLPKAFREGGWAELAGAAEVLAEFQRRRVPLSAPQLGQLQREVANALDQLAPVRQRIAAFDDLIERVVRRLYGVAGDG